MNGQLEALKTLLEGGQDPAGILFPCAADDKIVSETDQETCALEPWFDHPHEPVIQHMMEEYVAEHLAK